MPKFKPGDRIHVSKDDQIIDYQFRGQYGVVRRVLEDATRAGGGQFYDVEFDTVEPPTDNKPYGPSNYWRVREDNMTHAVTVELTPEGIEAFLNA